MLKSVSEIKWGIKGLISEIIISTTEYPQLRPTFQLDWQQKNHSETKGWDQCSGLLMSWDFVQSRVPTEATSKFSPLVLWGWHWHLAGDQEELNRHPHVFETCLSLAGNLCFFCGWITLVPVTPWEEESSVSSCRESEDWVRLCQLRSCPVDLPLHFYTAWVRAEAASVKGSPAEFLLKSNRTSSTATW